MNESVDRHSFQCSNGDKLDDLNARKLRAERQVDVVRQILEKALLELRPLNEQMDAAINERDNISCRLNIWWEQFKEANRVKDGQPKPTVHET